MAMVAKTLWPNYLSYMLDDQKTLSGNPRIVPIHCSVICVLGGFTCCDLHYISNHCPGIPDYSTSPTAKQLAPKPYIPPIQYTLHDQYLYQGVLLTRTLPFVLRTQIVVFKSSVISELPNPSSPESSFLSSPIGAPPSISPSFLLAMGPRIVVRSELHPIRWTAFNFCAITILAFNSRICTSLMADSKHVEHCPGPSTSPIFSSSSRE